MPLVETYGEELLFESADPVLETMGYTLVSDSWVPSGGSRLANVGNTCYMNSLLQCLGGLAPVRSWMAEHRKYRK